MKRDEDFLEENLADQGIRPTREILRKLRQTRERNEEDDRLDSPTHGQAEWINRRGW